MYCSRCGAQIASDSAFCPACGALVGAAGTAAGQVVVTRPATISLLAVLQFIAATFWFLFGLLLLAAALFSPDADSTSVLVAGLLIWGLAALQLACGLGLWRLQSYGRTIQLILGWIGLLGFPVGTVISILILLYLFKPGIKLLFSGRPQTALTPDERSQVAALAHESHVMIIITVLVVLVGGVVIVGMVAAIAIPGLLKARMSGNEAAAIATIRRMISAEVSYSTVNGGVYDKPECLASPARCLPTYSGPAFLDPTDASVVSKGGYTFEFRPGEPAGTDEIRRGRASPTSVVEFAYVATPMTPGTTGVRMFCGDSSGEVVAMTRDAATAVAGRCPPGSPLR